MINSSFDRVVSSANTRIKSRKQTPAKKRSQVHIIIGMSVYVLLAVALVSDWSWPPLAEIQQNNVYKQITGFLLMAFKWYLALLY